ncbi:HAD family hydrolase [Reinekea forsetii]|nr:HAD family hydrolase [Reinekea forsetii]
MYKAVVFDFGNTIAKSGSLANALKAVVVDEKAFVVGKQIEKEISVLYKPDQKKQPEWTDIWARCFERSGLPFSEGIGRRHLEEFCRSNETLPNVEKMLIELKRNGFKLGLLSNATGPKEIFQNDLEARGLAKYFDSVVWSCAIGYRKPSSNAFEAVLCELGVRPEETLMIGDSEIADIEGATKMGMDAALVSPKIGIKTNAKYQVAMDRLFYDVLAITKTGSGRENRAPQL